MKLIFEEGERMSTVLWHEDYERDWMRAFPLGNGRIGAMLYGDPYEETIEINEESLWSGRQIKEKYSSSPEMLAKIRRLLLEECYEEAAELFGKGFVSTPERVRFFESMGELRIEFPDKRRYENYRKELELSEAVGRVSYKKGKTEFISETFVSEKYDALVYKMKASSEFDCYVTMERGQDAYTSALRSNLLFMNGRVTSYDEEIYGEGGEGMSFGANIFVRTDGKLLNDKKHIIVHDATWVIVYGVFETNYNVEKYDIDESVDYRAVLRRKLDAVTAVDYETVKAEHIAAHKAVFDKVSFRLNAPTYDDIPVDWRLYFLQRQRQEDLDMYELYYNFGRYLLIESSGKNATLPANLQGIWCNGYRPEWGSDYHTNINLQMNYWPAEPANMAETVRPFIHFMKMISSFGRQTAKELLGCNGWVINHTTDVFGRTGPHDSAHCFFPMAGPWLCLNLWERYEFSGDRAVLSEIYPILKGSCEFVCDYLIEDGKGGLTTAPSNSPENWFYYYDKNGEKKSSMFTYGATMDFEIIRALFTRTVHACRVLGVDEDFAVCMENIMSRLPGLRVSERYGTVCEWSGDYEEVEPNHRHVSHMFALYPGDEINETNPEIYEAAKKTIARRLAKGGGSTGWSRAWTVNFYARLKDGENAWTHLQKLITDFTANNLFDIHPPFQIDGNFGGVAGINEMLLQSHLGEPDKRIIEILPALPDAWKSGSVSGMKARGNFTVDIVWNEGKAAKTAVTSAHDNVLRLKLNGRTGKPVAEKEFTVENGVLTMKLAAGETAEIEFQ
ncbi:MAG: glycoside hydrolase family 95 protein [Clostridia bacterium]|nr:glycoside hydrolase family 95 protein [Clostridia bacterium]